MYECIFLYICIYLIAFGTSATVHGGKSEASWTFVGISWNASRGLLGAVLKSLGSRVGASWGFVWASWGFLGASWGLLERKARIFGSCFPSWALLGAVFGASWAVLGASWAVFGPSWAVLGRSWGPLGPSWDGLGGFVGSLAARGRRKGDNAKNLQKPKGNQ